MNKEYLKRRELNSTIGFIEIYNPSPAIRKEMAEDVANMNAKMIEVMVREIKKNHGDRDEAIEANEIQQIFETIITEELNLDDLLIKYVTKLTNVPIELLEDKETLEDPSEDLRLAMKKINSFLSEFVDEYEQLFSANLAKALK